MMYVVTKDAPGMTWDYAQGVISNGLVYISGQLPVDPKTKLIESQTLRGQADRVCQNIAAICEAARTDIDHVVKTTCYISNINDEEEFNEVYMRYFEKSDAAKTLVEARLPKGALCMIEAVAEIDSKD